MAIAKAAKVTWRRAAEQPVIRDFVNFSIAEPCTYADVIQKIANALKWRVESMPDQLRGADLFRGYVVFGSAAHYLDRITAEHDNLYWTFSDGTLRFDVRAARIELSRFDELAGRLMHRAQREANGRILSDEYLRITSDLVDFKPTDFLEGTDRKNLATWNQTNPRSALHTFSKAYKDPRFRRAVLRRLNRAEAKYRKAHPGNVVLEGLT
jgi:hypothetical protein